MRRIFFISLILIVSTLWANETFTQEERQWIQENPVIKVGGGPDWAPFDFVDTDGNYKGISNDYLTLVSKLTGLKFEVKVDTWNSNLQKMKSGEIDLLDTVYYTKERSTYMNYAQSYFEMLDYFFIRKDLKIVRIEELDGKTIAIPRGYSQNEIIKKEFPRIKILTVETFSEAVDAVIEKRADILFDTYAVVSYVIQKEGLTDIVPFKSYRGNSVLKLHMTLTKSKPLLVSIVDKALSMITDREKQEIYDRWLGSNIGVASNLIHLTAKEKVWLKAHPVIRVSNEDDWSPFDFSLNGEAQGYSVDIVKNLAKKIGVKIDFINGYKWHELLELFEANKIDMMHVVSKTKSREKMWNLSKPYMKQELSYFIRIDEKNIHSLNDFSGKTIAAGKGWISTEILKKKFPKAIVVEYENTKDIMWAVSLKQADIGIDNTASATYVMMNEYISNLRSGGIVNLKDGNLEGQEYLYFATQKQNPELISIFNKALDMMGAQERVNIQKKWFGAALQKSENRVDIGLNIKEQKWIKKNPLLRLGADKAWAPFDFSEDGIHRGVSADFLTLIAQRTGLNIQVESGEWREVLQRVKENKLDGFSAITQNRQREEYLSFSTPYIHVESGIVVKNSAQKIHNIHALAGKRLGVVRGTYLEKWVQENYPQIVLELVETDEEGVNAVSFGKLDAYLGYIAVINYIRQRKLITDLKILSTLDLDTTNLAFGIRKDKPELYSIMQKALESISEVERLKILNYWYKKSEIGISLSYEERQWIANHPIVSYSEVNWEPMSIIKNGTMHGLMNDYLKRITKETGIKFQFEKASSWTDVLKKFKHGKIDIIPGIGESEHEVNLGLTSNTYANFPLVLVTQNRESFIGSIDELEEKQRVVAVPKHWTSYNYLKEKKPNIKVIGTKDVHEALDLVQSGKAYAFLGHMAIAMHYVGKYYSSTLHIAGKVEYNFNHKVLVQNNQKILLGIINKVFSNMSEKEHLDIKNKWLRVEVKEAKDYTLVYQIAIVLSLFLLGALYWNRRLTLEIQERTRIENALKVEKENFKVLFEKVSDGNLIIKNSRFVSCNAAALNMLGLKKVEQVLRSTPNQWSPELQPDGRNSTDKAKEMIEICITEGAHRFEWVHKDIDGNEFWVDVGLTKIFYEGSDAIYVVWRNIKEQKLLENSLKQSEFQMKTLINNIPLHVLVTTFEGRILLANPQALNDYNFDKDNLWDINILEFYAEPKQREEVMEEIGRVGRLDKKVVDFVRPDGIHSMLLSITPIRYNNEDVILSIGVDISERLKMEEDLLKAKNIAELANKSKSEFLANMSHEIRTPMNAIIGFTELLSDQVQEPRLKTYVSTIQSAGNTLLTLINDILDLSKIEAGKLLINKVPTDIYTLADEIGAMFLMAVRGKDIDFVVDVDEKVPPSLLIDTVRMRQVLINIVGNAVKFTEVGFVKLSISVLNVDEHLSKLDIKFIVEDTGIGIPEDKIEKIFREFEQNDGQDNRKFGGTGLGLSISQRLCNMMGGKITVSSVYGKGSTFEIALYGIDIASVVESRYIEEELSLDANVIVFKRAKVLVVDDIEDNRELILKNFEDTEIEIFTANDGLEAIAMFKEIRPDLILMDIRMPNMDGYEASKEIKKISIVPIIALTASVMEDELELKKRKSFDGYLRKPVFRYELFKELSNYLKHEIYSSDDDKEIQYMLSQKAKSNIGEILNILETEIVPLQEAVLKSNNISDMKEMVIQIHTLADKYEIEILQKYVYDFFEAIDVFDITKIDKLLNSLEDIKVEIISQAS